MLLQCVTTVAVVVGLILTLRQIRLLRISYRDLHDWNRRKAAHDAASAWAQFAEDTAKLESCFHFSDGIDAVSLEDTKTAFARDPLAQASLHRKLNYLESVASGVNHRVLDDDVIRSAFFTVLRKNLHRFASYIADRREKSPELWVDVRDLAAKWDADDQHRRERDRTGTS